VSADVSSVMSFARVRRGLYFATGSLSDSRCSSASIRSSEHVNCFVTEPMANIVRVVTVSLVVRSRTP
jgi:hypothetical protein